MRKYVRKYGKLFSVAVFFLTIEAVCDLLLPTILAKVIDVGIADKRMDVVYELGGIMLLITGIGALAATGRNILASRVSQRFGTELRSDLFKKIQSLSFENIDKFERASLVTRLTNDVTQVQNFANGLMRIFAKAPILCIGGLIMAVRLNPNLSVIFAIVVPIVALLIFLNLKVGFPRFMRVQEALDQVNRVMREYLSGVRVVKAFNRFSYEVEKFNVTNTEYQAKSTHVMRVTSIFNPAIMLAVNFGIVAVIWIGGLRIDAGQMQVGQIIAFINYMTQILFSLMMISMVFNMFIRAKASAVRIGELFSVEDTKPVTKSDNRMEVAQGNVETAAGRIDFEDVSFSYGSADSPVLKQINFSCMPGETVGLIGSTGSGKSSLIGLIPRFYDATSGVVKVNGVDVQKIDPKQLREKIAIVPQKTVLFTGTVSDNIRWGKEDATAEEIETAAKIAEVHHFVSSFPEGYDTILGQRGVNFSGGQKQRVSIARALIRNPQILILDDCTNAVDVATEAKIKQSLKHYAKQVTCIIIAQRITSVMDADQIVVLDQGEVAGIGKHEQLMQTCVVYREIFRSQIGKEMESNVETN